MNRFPDYPKPPFPEQQGVQAPGETAAMNPRPDHGEKSYRGSGKLESCVAIITGADSGIGRAIAIAFAREGADLVLSYLDEQKDAEETAELVRQAGRRVLLVPGDISSYEHCATLVQKALHEFSGIDILVNNAAFQRTHDRLEDIPVEEWQYTFATNIHPMFYLTKSVAVHMRPGSAIINTTSVQADTPSPQLLAYATTKGAIQTFTAGLAQLLGERGIRVNCVAPGPVWTPLIPSTMPAEKVEKFGSTVPLGRPAQPAELAGAYVFLASPDASYVSGATIAVTGGKPIL